MGYGDRSTEILDKRGPGNLTEEKAAAAPMMSTVVLRWNWNRD
jgi:hypothetical protein